MKDYKRMVVLVPLVLAVGTVGFGDHAIETDRTKDPVVQTSMNALGDHAFATDRKTDPVVNTSTKPLRPGHLAVQGPCWECYSWVDEEVCALGYHEVPWTAEESGANEGEDLPPHGCILGSCAEEHGFCIVGIQEDEEQLGQQLEVLLADLAQAVSHGRSEEIVRAFAAIGPRARLNPVRRAIQVEGCEGNGLLAHFPLSDVSFAAVAWHDAGGPSRTVSDATNASRPALPGDSK